jgi:hypothetical protein
VGQFDDGNALGPEKQDKRNKPEPDGDSAVGGDGWDDIQVENGDNEKQNEVHASQDAAQIRHAGSDVRGGRDDGLVLQYAAPSSAKEKSRFLAALGMTNRGPE